MRLIKPKDISLEVGSNKAIDSQLVNEVNGYSILRKILNASTFLGGLAVAYKVYKTIGRTVQERNQNAWKDPEFHYQDSSQY